MAKQRFANQASTLLATTLTDDALSLTVRLGDGSLFPNPTAGDWFLLTIQGNSLEFEIVKVTARSGDVMTIERAQEGTLALEWPADTPAVLRQTAGWLETVHTQDTFDPDEKVSGPESAVNEHLTVFDGTSGKVVKDGGSTIAQVIAAAAAAAPQGDVVGPASSGDEQVPVFDGASGKAVKDSGMTVSDIVAAGAAAAPQGDVVGPASAVNERIAVFDGTSGELIKDGGKTIAEVIAEGGGAGDISGPVSSTNNAVAVWDGADGDTLKDSNVLVGDIVQGPASSTDDRVATFDGVTGKVIQDGGKTIAEIEAAAAAAAPQGDVVGPVSAVSGALALFDGTTGKALMDSGRVYVEGGTFTPTITFGDLSTGITYSAQVGHYSRIGNMVFFGIEIMMTNKGSATGAARFANLPFTSINQPSPGSAWVRVSNMASLSGSHIQAVIAANSTTSALIMALGSTDTTASGNLLTDANFTDTSILRASGFYFVPIL